MENLSKDKAKAALENKLEHLIGWFFLLGLSCTGIPAMLAITPRMLLGKESFGINSIQSLGIDLEFITYLAGEFIGLSLTYVTLEILTSSFAEQEDFSMNENLSEEVRGQFEDIQNKPKLIKLLLPTIILVMALYPTVMDTVVYMLDDGASAYELLIYLEILVSRALIASPIFLTLLGRIAKLKLSEEAVKNLQKQGLDSTVSDLADIEAKLGLPDTSEKDDGGGDSTSPTESLVSLNEL